jgi:hypothetical protein
MATVGSSVSSRVGLALKTAVFISGQSVGAGESLAVAPDVSHSQTAGLPDAVLAGEDDVRLSLILGDLGSYDPRVHLNFLEDLGYRVTPDTKRLYSQPNFVYGPAGSYTVESVSLRMLGFRRPAMFPDVQLSILRHGYDLCPHGLASVIRSHIPKQKDDTWIRIAMNPIRDSFGVPRIFVVGAGRTTQSGPCLWLSVAPVENPDGSKPYFMPDDKFLLVKNYSTPTI